MNNPFKILVPSNAFANIGHAVDSDCGDCNGCDCACVDLDHHPSLPVAALSTLQRAPHLLRRELPDRHELVFNSHGAGGMAVLNQPALQLLDSFAAPVGLREMQVRMPGYDEVHIAEAARQLYTLGLLESMPVVEHSALASHPRTLSAWLHLSNACNLACDYCYLQKTAGKMSLARGKQAVDAVFRSALAHGFKHVKLKYAGGEPTLEHSLILALHVYARELAGRHALQLSGVVLTNATHLTPAMLADLKQLDLRLSISLDGIGKSHDAQRKFADGRGSFALLERSLDLLAAHNLQHSITITVSRRNLPALPQTVGYVVRRGLPFSINFYRENDCSATQVDLAYGDDEIIAAMRAAFAMIETDLPDYSLLGTLADRARLDAPHDRPCGVGQNYLVIDAFGNISRCQMQIDQVVSTVDAPDPLQVIQMDRSGVQNPSVQDKPDCVDCQWSHWCAGGCPLQARRNTGQYTAKSPNCRIYQAIFPEILRLEGLRLLKAARTAVI